MLPNLIVIGAAKCGTTSLHRYLDLHPEVHMSEMKETNFFAPSEDEYPFGRIADLTRYEAQFDTDLPIRGESSPAYAVYPFREGVPGRMHALIPDAKLILCVRDPIARIQALYVHRADWQASIGSFRDEIGDVDDPRNEYVCGSSYMLQLDQYLRLFPTEAILVVDQDDLRGDRQATLERVFRFLGVDEGFDAGAALEVHHNASDQKRRHSALSARVARSRSIRAALDRLPRRAHDAVLSAGRQALKKELPSPEVDADLRAALTRRLAPDAARLRAFTGQPFGTWTV